MEPLIALVGFAITIAVFLVTVVGAVLYLRADARTSRLEWKAESEANRQEWKAESEANRREWKAESEANRQELKTGLEANRQEWKAGLEANRQEWKTDLAMVMVAINGLRDDVARLDRRLTALEIKVDAVEEKLSSQAERNHRELLIRLAFHHHGDGRYPISAAADPEPVDPTDAQ